MIQDSFFFSEGFVELPVRHWSGVYLLMRDQEVLYVGQSESVYTRITAHRNGLNNSKKQGVLPQVNYLTTGDIRMRGIPFNRVLIRHCPSGDQHALEREYIHRLKPPYNLRVPEKTPAMRMDLDLLAAKAGITKWETRRPKDWMKRRHVA